MATNLLLLFLLLNIFGIHVDANEPYPFIYGGRDAKLGEFPYQVSIQNRNPFTHICGGSIITPSWILTAAHCTFRFIDQIVAGMTDFNEMNPERQERKIKRIIVHPGFSLASTEKDIGLIELDKPLKFNKFVKAIGLPEPGLESEGKVEMCGWGRVNKPNTSSDQLKAVTTTIIPQSVCEKRASIGFNHKNHICTGSKLGEGGCYGDTGGPLIQNQQVIGITSFFDANCGQITIFTKVSCFIDFIKKHVKNIKH